MSNAYEQLAGSLGRADELLNELINEYEQSLRRKEVSSRAVNLTHEVAEKLRGILDRTARRYWDNHISPSLSEEERLKAKVYFPITANHPAFDSMMGKWQWKRVRHDHQKIYDYLLNLQPFNKGDWLRILDDLAIKSKHIGLTPQKRTEQRSNAVRSAEGGVQWVGDSLSLEAGGSIELGPDGEIVVGPDEVTFSGSISVIGAPIDPLTQRILPTPGVVQCVEIWVDFLIEGHGVSAALFCEEACRNVRSIVTDMTRQFALS